VEEPSPIILPLLFFSSPAQEVLPLTNLLSLQVKVLIFDLIGANYFGHFEASSLIFTYVLASLHIFKWEVPDKRRSGSLKYPVSKR
jgi:hypothetical protein